MRPRIALAAQIVHARGAYACPQPGSKLMPMRVRLILILGSLTAFGPLSVDMYLPSFPALARDLDTDAASVQVTLSAFLFGLAVGQLVYGPLSDRFGRRVPLLAGLAVYVAAAIACALAPNIESLWAARFAQSIGACACIVIARAAVRDRYHGAEAARFFSMLMLVLGAAPIVGPQLGAFILTNFGWRGIFWFLALFSAATFAAVLLGLPESLPPERRARGGIVPALLSYLTLLRDRRFLAPTLAADFVFAGLFAFIAGGPFVFIELHGLTPQGFGILFSVNALGLLLASQINVLLVHWYGPSRMLTASLLIYCGGALALLVNAATGFGGFAGLAVPLFISFSMVGMAPTNALALAQEHYPHAAGSATALFGSIQFGIGAVIGVLTGLFHDGTALPMAGLIFAAAAISVAINVAFGTRPPPAPAAQGSLS
jgi:DHA1 family bicyclomycin/chloramphenicol resistance-like MFS transporter